MLTAVHLSTPLCAQMYTHWTSFGEFQHGWCCTDSEAHFVYGCVDGDYFWAFLFRTALWESFSCISLRGIMPISLTSTWRWDTTEMHYSSFSWLKHWIYSGVATFSPTCWRSFMCQKDVLFPSSSHVFLRIQLCPSSWGRKGCAMVGLVEWFCNGSSCHCFLDHTLSIKMYVYYCSPPLGRSIHPVCSGLPLKCTFPTSHDQSSATLQILVIIFKLKP